MASTLRTTLLATGFTLVGLALGLALTPRSGVDCERPPVAPRPDAERRLARLKADLHEARLQLGRLREERDASLLTDGGAPTAEVETRSATLTLDELPEPAEPSAEVAPVTSSSEALAARVAELEARLQDAIRGELVLTDAEVRQRVSELGAKLDGALESGDSATALATMTDLAEMDERAFPALLEAWQSMREQGWMGLTGAQRRLWIRGPVLHWALGNEDLGIEGKDAQRFKVMALRMLPHYEPDKGRQAETLAKVFAGLDGPGETDPRRLRRGWHRNGDLYRGTLDRLSRIPGEVTSGILQRVADNTRLPADVRRRAVSSLWRQQDRGSARVLEAALRDNDPGVRRAAQIASLRRAPPATGILLTRVNRKGLGARSGFTPGAVVTRYNGRPVRNQRELRRAMARSRGKTVVVELNAGGVIRKVSVPGGKNLGLASYVPVRRR